MHHVAALALPDVVALQLSTPAQIFGHRAERNRYTFTVCAEEPGPVTTTTGFAIQADTGLSALESADTVIIPGFWPPDDPSDAVLEGLHRAAARGARIASVCTGAFALAAAGLLDGRTATTHWQEADNFTARFPAVELRRDVLYVDEGRLLSGAGDAAGIDLFLHLFAGDHGAAAAAEVARRMVAPVHRGGGQPQSLQRPLPRSGPALEQTRAWAIHELDRPLTVTQLARHAGLAPRTFARHFLAETGMTPLRWLTAQRLLEARRLLEASDLSIDEVARRCGLGTPANLRTHLGREADMTPSGYRNAFRGHHQPPSSSEP
jgi:transcriptional regulator GlxA family with amidase domain